MCIQPMGQLSIPELPFFESMKYTESLPPTSFQVRWPGSSWWEVLPSTQTKHTVWRVFGGSSLCVYCSHNGTGRGRVA